MMKAKVLSEKFQKRYAKEIEFAKFQGFSAVLISFSDDSMPYYLEAVSDEEYLYDLLEEYDLEYALLIDLDSNKEHIVNILEEAS
jgi:hypothetical protein